MWDLKIRSAQQVRDRLSKRTTRGKLDDLLTIGLDSTHHKQSQVNVAIKIVQVRCLLSVLFLI